MESWLHAENSHPRVIIAQTDLAFLGGTDSILSCMTAPLSPCYINLTSLDQSVVVISSTPLMHKSAAICKAGISDSTVCHYCEIWDKQKIPFPCISNDVGRTQYCPQSNSKCMYNSMFTPWISSTTQGVSIMKQIQH